MLEDYALSTCWNIDHDLSGYDIVRPMIEAGFRRIELGAMLTERQVRDILAMVEAGEVVVTDVHNVCPAPGGQGYDFFLTDLDEEKRAEAVHLTLRSIETAHRAGADRLVVHMGRVEVDPGLVDDLLKAYDAKAEWEGILDEILRQRAERQERHWDALRRSLDEILPVAQRLGVTLAAESRYSPHEMTSFEETGRLMDAYPAVRYWHDVGHCQVQELLGLQPHEAWLEAYRGRLVGIHIHDISGRFDHRAPGMGNLDFRRLAPIPQGALKVLEVHSTATADDLRRAVELLDEALGTPAEELEQ